MKKKRKTGLRFNDGKVRWRNVPLFLLEDLMKVGHEGEKKYDTFNFLNGMYVNDCLDSAKRHMMKAESPKHSDLDSETKLHHLSHAAWNLIVARYMIENRPDLDDRHKTQSTKLKKQRKKK
jgi:hypothetical protein